MTKIEIVTCPQCGHPNSPPSFLSNSQRMTCDWCHGVSLISPEQIKTAEVHTYWALHCRSCSFITALAKANTDSSGTFRYPADRTVIEVDCPVCYRKQEYERPQVFLWNGPPPAPDFHAHPAFL